MSSPDIFVIPDMHGNRALAEGLLAQEGLVDYERSVPIRSRDDVVVIQLGDLCNCVFGSINDDLYALKLVEHGIIDIMLIGNHEHPYFGGPPFNGFGWFAELKSALLKLNDRGKIRAAYAAGDILITHAGVTADADQIDRWANGEHKAREMAAGLNYLWDTGDYAHAMFSAIGSSRGGSSKYGGILWSDWSEDKTEQFPQIVGHTVGDEWRFTEPIDEDSSILLVTEDERMPVQAVCIDVGAGKNSSKILGAWIKNREVEIVEYERKTC